jgi:hypothetical protein
MRSRRSVQSLCARPDFEPKPSAAWRRRQPNPDLGAGKQAEARTGDHGKWRLVGPTRLTAAAGVFARWPSARRLIGER